MASRPFAPTQLNSRNKEFHACAVEARLISDGEYVQHIHEDGTFQWLVMNFQYIPVDASINPDFAIGSTDPKLWGLAAHFDVQPKRTIEGDAHDPQGGSTFEVRGLIYFVKKVNINHQGGIYIEIVQEDKCAEPRADFCDDVEALLCSSEL